MHMIIAQISDTHIALDTADAAQRLSDFARTIAHINTLDPQPDVIIHTGDVVHNGLPEEYAQAIATLSEARAPVYVLAGNKDDRANLRAAFSVSGYLSLGSGFIQYAIEVFPIRLLVLDTLSTASNKGDFCAERARHLIEMVDADATSRSPYLRITAVRSPLAGQDPLETHGDGAARKRYSSRPVVGSSAAMFIAPRPWLLAHSCNVATSRATTLVMWYRPIEPSTDISMHRFSPTGVFGTRPRSSDRTAVGASGSCSANGAA